MSQRITTESLGQAATFTTAKATLFLRKHFIPKATDSETTQRKKMVNTALTALLIEIPIITGYRTLQKQDQKNKILLTQKFRDEEEEFYAQRRKQEQEQKQREQEQKDLEQKKRKQEQEQKDYEILKTKHLEKEGLIPCTDPEILSIFNTIKKDLGIPENENIPLFEFATNRSEPAGLYIRAPFQCTFKTVGIAINLKKMRNDHPALLINTIAHELGHHLQTNESLDSYQSIFKSPDWWMYTSPEERKEDSIKVETGADANAAGYQDCKDCLMSVKRKIRNRPGSIANAQGYFSDTDYDLYIQRATEEGWRCPAHEDQQKEPFYKQASYMMGFNKPAYKLHQYLPSTYNRSRHPAFTMEAH